MTRIQRWLVSGALAIGLIPMTTTPGNPATGREDLVIVASPSLKAPMEAIARAFEDTHREVRVRLYYETAFQMRQMLARMQNTGRHHIGSGPFHVIAPGGHEIITRLEQKYYVLPGTRRPYALARLVLVVPANLENAPSSFKDLATNASLRVSIVDPNVSTTGRLTKEFLEGLGLADALKDRLDIAHDPSGVLDHILHGRADVGVVLNPELYRQRDLVRVVAEAPEGSHSKIVYEVAMDRFCPNRRMCEEFMDFTQSPEAKKILKRLGYGVPVPAKSVVPAPKDRQGSEGKNSAPSESQGAVESKELQSSQ